MLWKDGRRSENIEDERGAGRRIAGGGGKLGIGSIVAILAISYFTGQNPLQLLGMLQDSGLGSSGQTEVAQVPQSAESNEQADFVSVVLASTEDTWGRIFSQYGKQYEQPKLKLFTGEVQSACGNAQSAMGPFYCPADHKVYIDLDFFQELENRMGAGGDFARAYVVGHEIGHHVQNLLGTSTKVHQARQQMSETQGNQLSVKLELQADCYAGIWAHHADAERPMLEAGDIEEAITAAAAVGDDQIMKSAGRAVNPEAFTHGSSKERMRWFQVGMQQGDLNACNTFK